jgi:calcineurin-like phosphoesterase family protein
MDKIWLISDTHFGHDRITSYCDRPYTWADLIIANWKACVGTDDTIYHLGDLAFVNGRNRCTFQKMFSELPGRKILIKGNHDRASKAFYTACGFEYHKDSMLFQTIGNGVVLSHKPEKMEFPYANAINIHGHFHNNVAERWEADLKALLTEKHLLFSLEETGYKPIELSEALKEGTLIKTLERSLKGNKL